MALLCPGCAYPARGHEAGCPRCGHVLQSESEAAAARERWDALSAPAREEFDAEFARRLKAWEESHQFYQRRGPIKHMAAGALAFGVAGLFCGWMALAYAAAGALAGKILNRYKGGPTLGAGVGLGVFGFVILVRAVITAILPMDLLTYLFYALSNYYSDRIVGFVCPAMGAILGIMIQHEFEEKG